MVDGTILDGPGGQKVFGAEPHASGSALSLLFRTAQLGALAVAFVLTLLGNPRSALGMLAVTWLAALGDRDRPRWLLHATGVGTVLVLVLITVSGCVADTGAGSG
jgi:bacteriorhodopsin